MSTRTRNVLILVSATLIIGIGAWYAFTQDGGTPSQPVGVRVSSK